MIHLAALLAAFALIGLGLMFGVMVLVGGLRWDDVRDLLLHDAYRSFTFEGDVRVGAVGVSGLPGEADERLVLRAIDASA